MAKRKTTSAAKLPRDAVFSTRMPVHLRKRLEAAARANGRKLSPEIIHRLETSFDTPKGRDPFMRGLSRLIDRAADFIPAEGDLKSSPYKFAAFQSAVMMLLTMLQPPGEPTAPAETPEWARSPVDVGTYVAAILFAKLTKTPEIAGIGETEAMAAARNELGVPTEERRHALALAALLMEGSEKGETL